MDDKRKIGKTMMKYESIPQVAMVRPVWIDKEYHRNKLPVTVLMCHYATLEHTRLALNSLLRFYPDIDILVVNGSTHDKTSTDYLRFMELKHDNIRVYEKENGVSHGVNMDDAIRNHITSDYVLLMDSDVIVMRGGFIEDMINELKVTWCTYAVGTLMIGSNENDAIGYPHFDGDELRYAHPSCSLYNRSIYLELRPFCDHGAPCVYNMKDAAEAQYDIEYYPVDKYVLHLSGASWIKPRTQWGHDNDVFIRPFITFVVEDHNKLSAITPQTDNDYDIVFSTQRINEPFVIHDKGNYNVDNIKYSVRFNVLGEYVCDSIPSEIMADFIELSREQVIKHEMPEFIDVDGCTIYRRDFWQRNVSML